MKESWFDTLLNEVPWVNKEAPRDECFMSLVPLEYTYGNGFTRTYKSIKMHNKVLEIMKKMNMEFKTDYDVCFLNFYKSEKEWLGWHADDSPEMDSEHPIAVISFGVVRDIWVKNKDYKGEISEENKYKLSNGSLFIMPAGYQANNKHKIPKGDKPCGGRISLTFRKFKNIN